MKAQQVTLIIGCVILAVGLVLAAFAASGTFKSDEDRCRDAGGDYYEERMDGLEAHTYRCSG